MIKEGKIGVQEAVSLIVITITVKAYFTSPTYVAKVTGPASWYMTLFSTAGALIGFTFMYHLLRRFPEKNLMEAYELSIGRIIGSVFSLVSAFYLLIICALLIREFTEVTKVYILPLSPPSSIIGVMISLIAVGSFYGFEAIARFSKLMAYILLIGFFLVIILSYNHYDYRYLFPIFGNGIPNTLSYGLSRSSFYGEVIILGVFASSLQGTDHIKKIGIRALSFSGVITSSMLMSTMMAFGYPVAQEPTSRFYELTRMIHTGNFLQRLDPLFIFSWCIGSFISVMAVFYSFQYTYCNIFRIKDIRPIIVPTAVITFTLSMLPEDLTSVADYINITRLNGWVVLFGLPFFALITAILRKKGRSNEK